MPRLKAHEYFFITVIPVEKRGAAAFSPETAKSFNGIRALSPQTGGFGAEEEGALELSITGLLQHRREYLLYLALISLTHVCPDPL